MGGSGREGVGLAEETESTLALAENVYVNLSRPYNFTDPFKAISEYIKVHT